MKDPSPSTNSIYGNNIPIRFAFIIGAMKAGTTSLFDILSQHPNICPSKVKEPDYFIEDRPDSSLQDYLALWNFRNNLHTIALESSVAYTKAPLIKGVPERIFRSGLGEYRFIYMLRDPLSRIESQVRQGIFSGWGKSLDTGITDDLIYFSSYAMQLDHYLRYFSKDDLILITLEEFQLDPHAVLSRLCKFLEIDNEFRFSNVEEPRNSGDFFNASSGIARITQGNIGQFIARRILPSRTKNWLRKCLSRPSNGKESSSNHGRWKLNPEERTFILNRLSEDLGRLQSEFGIDVLKYWDIPENILDLGK